MRPRLRDHEARAGAGDEAAAAVAAGAPADQPDHRHAGPAQIGDGPHDLGDGGLAGIGLLQPDAAGIEQDQHRRRLHRERGPQQADELGAMDLAEGPAHEPPLLRGQEDERTVEASASHHDAVVEGARQVEGGQVRTHHPLFGAEELLERAGIDEGVEAGAGAGLVPALVEGIGGEGDGAHRHHTASISRAPWSRRRVTVSGRAPPSLMVMRRPPGCRRATKSETTASQTDP